MSFTGGLECVLILGCTRWAWKRCTYIGAYDSASWPPASADELVPIPRLCRLILANYEGDLSRPRFQPADSTTENSQNHTNDPSSFNVKPEWVVKRVTYEDAQGRSPPYLIYTDRDSKELVLAIRGLNLIKESDYKLLLNNSLGRQMFDGGYVHYGLLKAAIWVLNRETVTLRETLQQLGPEYKLVFTGHSLGSGIAALMTVLLVNHLYRFEGIPRSQVRCYAIAPARCMSLNLAVKYADVISSVVLQDDFLPRTATPLEYIFSSIFCLPCFLFLVCLRDTFIPEGRKLRDPRRLYAPGRMYHIVERKFCRCGRFPPEVRTAVPVEGRFEHIVLSCNTTQDHAIMWIEREARKALENMKDPESVCCPPPRQKMERMETMKKEHEDALERVTSLNISSADADDMKDQESAEGVDERIEQRDGDGASSTGESKHKNNRSVSWDVLVERLFDRNESGNLVLKKNVEALQ